MAEGEDFNRPNDATAVPQTDYTSNFAYEPSEWREAFAQLSQKDPTVDGVLDFKDLGDIYGNSLGITDDKLSVKDAGFAAALLTNRDVADLDGKPGVSTEDIARLTGDKKNADLAETVWATAVNEGINASLREGAGLTHQASDQELLTELRKDADANRRKPIENARAIADAVFETPKRDLGLPNAEGLNQLHAPRRKSP